MKKLITLMLSLAFVLCLCGCGTKSIKLKYGETASTDVVSVKIFDPSFALYESSWTTTPLDEPAGQFSKAPKGKAYVFVKAAITNNNKWVEDANILPSEFIIKYKGKEYKTHMWNVVSISGTNNLVQKGDIRISIGQTVTINLVGEVDFVPDSLDDDFETFIQIYDSEEEPTTFSFSK